MPIISAEILTYRSAVWSTSPSTNGGTISNNAVASTAGSLFPDVYEAERVAGATSYRKVFQKVNNAQNLELVSPKVYLHGIGAGDHSLRVAPASARADTEAEMLASTPDWYGCMRLNAGGVVAGSTSIVCVEEDSVPVVRAGDTLYITDKATPASVGVEERVGVVSVSRALGLSTINLASPLINSYSASVAFVSTIVPAANLKAKVNTPVVASTAGSLAANAIAPNGVGTVDATFTITFTSPSVFTLSNNAGIPMSSTTGSTSGSFAPVGPFNAPLFSILPTAWATGPWVAGDTVTFTTESASVPLWVARVVPTGSTNTAATSFSLVIDGESA